MAHSIRPTIAAAVVAVAAAFPAHAEAPPSPAELARQLQASLLAIQALQQRVGDLEQKLSAATATGTAASAPAQATASTGAPAAPAAPDLGHRVDQVEQSVADLQVAASHAQQKDSGVALHGFSDVKLGTENAAERAMPFRDYSGTAVGTLDLYMTPQISPQIKTLFEIALEYDNFDQSLGVDVERAQLGYVFSDAATLWAGRFHTPYGYWNTAFHHGAQLQTALTRPQFLDFEDSGGVLPAHSVGAWLTGSQHLSAGKLGYDVYVNNSDIIDGGELYFQPLRKALPGMGAGFRLNFTPAGTSLTAGLHGLEERVTGDNADATASGTVAMHMMGGYAVYDDDNWELMGEYYHFRNRDLAGGSGTHSSDAWYTQAAYNIDDRFTPYLRLEEANFAAADPYFSLQTSGVSYRKAFVGLRYNLTPSAAVKVEGSRGKQAGTAGDPSALLVQYGIRF